MVVRATVVVVARVVGVAAAVATVAALVVGVVVAAAVTGATRAGTVVAVAAVVAGWVAGTPVVEVAGVEVAVVEVAVVAGLTLAAARADSVWAAARSASPTPPRAEPPAMAAVRARTRRRLRSRDDSGIRGGIGYEAPELTEALLVEDVGAEYVDAGEEVVADDEPDVAAGAVVLGTVLLETEVDAVAVCAATSTTAPAPATPRPASIKVTRRAVRRRGFEWAAGVRMSYMFRQCAQPDRTITLNLAQRSGRGCGRSGPLERRPARVAVVPGPLCRPAAAHAEEPVAEEEVGEHGQVEQQGQTQASQRRHRYQRDPAGSSRAKMASTGRRRAAAVPSNSWPCRPHPMSS